jgi:hypothetical protein
MVVPLIHLLWAERWVRFLAAGRMKFKIKVCLRSLDEAADEVIGVAECPAAGDVLLVLDRDSSGGITIVACEVTSNREAALDAARVAAAAEDCRKSLVRAQLTIDDLQAQVLHLKRSVGWDDL